MGLFYRLEKVAIIVLSMVQPHKDTDRTEISTKAAKGSKAITMANVLEEALNGTTTDKVKEAENMEKAELRTERANEGATKND